jgi:TldD protein
MPTVLADAKNMLSDLMARYGSRVDYLAIRLEESEGTSILLRGDKIETLSEGLAMGGQVRACYKGGWGFASFNQLSTLIERVEEAIAAARIVGDEETILAPVKPVEAICQLPLTGTDPAKIPLREKNNCAIATTKFSRTMTPASPQQPCVIAIVPSELLLPHRKEP